MDDFVKGQLRLCNCGHVIETFEENEVDEVTFRALTLDDLRVMLPNKVGLQKKIADAVDNLKKASTASSPVAATSQAALETSVVTPHLPSEPVMGVATDTGTGETTTEENPSLEPAPNPPIAMASHAEFSQGETEPVLVPEPSESGGIETEITIVSGGSDAAAVVTPNQEPTAPVTSNVIHGTPIELASSLESSAEPESIVRPVVALPAAGSIPPASAAPSQSSGVSLSFTASLVQNQSPFTVNLNQNKAPERTAREDMDHIMSLLNGYSLANNAKEPFSKEKPKRVEAQPECSPMPKAPPGTSGRYFGPSWPSVASSRHGGPPGPSDASHRYFGPPEMQQPKFGRNPPENEIKTSRSDDAKLLASKQKGKNKKKFTSEDPPAFKPNHLVSERNAKVMTALFKHPAGVSGPPFNDQVKNQVVSTSHTVDIPREQSILRCIPPAILKRRQKLPIYFKKEEFISKMNSHQVLIVTGETGSGKSTQLTQYLLEAGFGTTGKIGCTQPRRVAAKALAKRVAEEAGSEMGDRVGYRVRFDNRTANNTSIIYMTDGILLSDLAMEPFVYSYAAIMLDEAHERSLNTDILLGLLKSVMRKRPELKILISSATLDSQKFSTYFGNAPIFKIPGRTFPVEIEHQGLPEPDYVNACVSTVMRIHKFERNGDILVFLGGQDEIERCCDLIVSRIGSEDLWVLPCYGQMSIEEQNLVFEPIPKGYKRKVVIATNIAETSITIDGVVFVVDSGRVKMSEYDPRKRLSTLTSVLITQAQAIQRAGRAGRTQSGKCFRLYSEETFKKMRPAPVPEIQRSNLESTVLLLAAHGVEDFYDFDFMDPPPREALEVSVTELQDLEAFDGQGRLTQLGRQLSRFPLDPKLSKILITSHRLGVSPEILTILSLLSVQQTSKIFLRPKKKQFQADQARASFFKPEGDHHTFLNVFNQWERMNYSKEWCQKHFVNYKALMEALDVREQLEDIMDSNNLRPSTESSSLSDPQAVQKCILAGNFSQIAYKTARGHGYMTYANPVEKELAFMHPSSALFKSTPNWVIYEEVRNTGSKTYLMNVVAVNPRWVQEFAPSFYSKLVKVFPQLAMGFLY